MGKSVRRLHETTRKVRELHIIIITIIVYIHDAFPSGASRYKKKDLYRFLYIIICYK